MFINILQIISLSKTNQSTVGKMYWVNLKLNQNNFVCYFLFIYINISHQCGLLKISLPNIFFHFLILYKPLKRELCMSQMVKNLPAMKETWVRSLSWKDPPEKGVTAHRSILAGRVLWTEEPLKGINERYKQYLYIITDFLIIKNTLFKL